MSYLIQFILTAGIIYFGAQYGYISDISISNGYSSVLIFAVILALVNLVIGTILRILTLPLNIITLGTFSFIISLIVVKITDEFVPGITLNGAIPLIEVAIISGITSFVVKLLR